MQNTSDIIELFLKDLISRQNGELLLKRNELAGQFNCAPSQINYVLATRFSVNRGYIVTSRKGGGGYIRITSIDMSKHDYLLHIINQTGDSISQPEAVQIINGLYERGIVTIREAKLMICALNDYTPGNFSDEECRKRAEILNSMMLVLINNDESN